MRLPVIQGLIKRRILLNFRVAPEALKNILPGPFRPKLVRGQAIAGICLIRLENIRPKGLPGFVGLHSENAAHRIAVEWNDDSGALREGVYIPRRDTDSNLNLALGGRIFPGETHRARFEVHESGPQIDFTLASQDGVTRVHLKGAETTVWPAGSVFESLDEASKFFATGSVGFSVTSDPARLDGVTLKTQTWAIGALEISAASASFYEDPARFPSGSFTFDNALIMRNIEHEWHATGDMACTPGCAGAPQ